MDDIRVESADARIHEFMWQKYIEAGQQALRLKNSVEALHMFNLAYERSQSFADDDCRQLQSLHWLAKTLTDNHQYARAEQVLEPLMHELFSKFGKDSVEMLDALVLLATIYEHQYKYTAAAKLLKYVLDNHPKKNTSRLDPDFQKIQRQFYAVRQLACNPSNAEVTWLH